MLLNNKVHGCESRFITFEYLPMEACSSSEASMRYYEKGMRLRGEWGGQLSIKPSGVYFVRRYRGTVPVSVT